ncbi:MAG TPA: hypothetical protein VHO03_03700 [Ignavibacteriales bacterium]|nr:hypothetical protein [Ignavibacteriales bacterium]
MRIEISEDNQVKILQAAAQLGISPTTLVNTIIESVNIKVELQVEEVELKFHKGVIEKKDSKSDRVRTNRKGNFVTDF